jgi:DNA polymerase-3 subunit gamma/tau
VTTGSHYTVLARRFRPQAFDDVVGQEPVARALTNAIRAGRVAHAYMFTGARGVGKTSMARILAKALNCPNAVGGVPCNQCEICQGISAGNDVDVMEIDGASNRGIDDIRALRANVGVRSMRTQYKVYIIDEVHALSKEAFNALLKTLEEPPPNVKFVFCTTEPNKVPDTILSRCQRFDFSSIDDQSIADRLRAISKIEGFEVSEDALELIARRARGSMRDSQSLFDQLLAFSDGTVSAEDVHRMLGTAGDERLVELFDAVVEHRPGEVLAQLDASFNLGVQPGELMDQIIGYVRDLMVTLTGGTSVSLCSVASRHRPILLKQATRLGMHSVMAAFQILSDGKNHMFRSTFARTVMEMALVQVSLLENLTALSDLLSGKLPDLTAAATASATESASAGDEKKNAEALTTLPRSTQPDVHSESYDDEVETDDISSDDISSGAIASDAMTVTESPAVSAPFAELTQANCSALLQELLKFVGLKINTGLKMVSELVLAAPNLVELLLDSKADFAKKVLDQPDNRAKIETEIRRLTGKSIGIQVRVITSARQDETVFERTKEERGLRPQPARKTESSAGSGRVSTSTTVVPPRNLLGEVDSSSDPFVRKVQESFGATIVKITAAASLAAEESEG